MFAMLAIEAYTVNTILTWELPTKSRDKIEIDYSYKVYVRGWRRPRQLSWQQWNTSLFRSIYLGRARVSWRSSQPQPRLRVEHVCGLS